MFESLEHRTMFDGGTGGGTTGGPPPPPPVGISMSSGIVTIKGADTTDVGTASIVNGMLHVTLKRTQWVDTDWGSGPFVVQNVAADFNPALVTKIFFYGVGGNDAFTNDTSEPSYAAGGSGNDLLTGGSGSDELHGNGGDDDLLGRGGNDSVWGSTGSDLLVGGAGSDYLHAQDGNAGNDQIFGDNQDGTGGFGSNDIAVLDVMSGWFFYDNFSGVEQISYV